ncbi:hypothetical protein ACP4OV_014459 [Aristida adscensionis]
MRNTNLASSGIDRSMDHGGEEDDRRTTCIISMAAASSPDGKATPDATAQATKAPAVVEEQDQGDQKQPPATTPPPTTTTKKTKTVVKRLTPEEVAKVLAYKPKSRSMLPPEQRPRQTEMLLRHAARVDELIKGTNDLVRRSQEEYRRQLDDKGYVEIQVEVDLTDDDDDEEPQA